VDLSYLATLENLDDVTKSIYFILLNSLSKLGSVIKEIDNDFTEELFAENDSMIKGIMIVTIICCIIIFIASTIILPYIFSLDRQSL